MIGPNQCIEYAAKQPKFAKLMDAGIADATAMKTMTDTEIDDKWGERQAVAMPSAFR
jgi:hypothetical protein